MRLFDLKMVGISAANPCLETKYHCPATFHTQVVTLGLSGALLATCHDNTMWRDSLGGLA